MTIEIKIEDINEEYLKEKDFDLLDLALILNEIESVVDENYKPKNKLTLLKAYKHIKKRMNNLYLKE